MREVLGGGRCSCVRGGRSPTGKPFTTFGIGCFFFSLVHRHAVILCCPLVYAEVIHCDCKGLGGRPGRLTRESSTNRIPLLDLPHNPTLAAPLLPSLHPSSALLTALFQLRLAMSMGLSGALSGIRPQKARGYPGRVLLDKLEFKEHSSICLIQVYPNKIFLFFKDCLIQALSMFFDTFIR